jgi:hypothetical protein
MYSQWFIFFLLIILSTAEQRNKSIVLHIGGLFDFDHPSIDNGRQDFQAAQMAIDEINTRYHDLFNGVYTLSLLANNSRVRNKEIVITFIVL